MRDEFTHGQLAHHEREAIRAMENVMPLEEIDNDELIYADVRAYTTEQYMAEQERCNEVIELNATTGVDIGYWIDRAAMIEDMRRQRRANIQGLETF